jgi:DNA transformation protein and related proteins
MPGRIRASRKLQPMKVTDGFRAFVLDQLEELGDVTARPMVGGVGLYRDGLFFGIVAGDVLYLKVDDATRGDYVKEGMAPFNPYARRPLTMGYYAVPPAVLESALELARWARKAIQVAARAPEKRRGKRR